MMMALTKKLTAIGNSYGIVIDRPILELLGITPETELELRTDDGQRIVVEPKRLAKRARLEAAHSRTVRNHGETFRKLAK